MVLLRETSFIYAYLLNFLSYSLKSFVINIIRAANKVAQKKKKKKHLGANARHLLT